MQKSIKAQWSVVWRFRFQLKPLESRCSISFTSFFQWTFFIETELSVRIWFAYLSIAQPPYHKNKGKRYLWKHVSSWSFLLLTNKSDLVCVYVRTALFQLNPNCLQLTPALCSHRKVVAQMNAVQGRAMLLIYTDTPIRRH